MLTMRHYLIGQKERTPAGSAWADCQSSSSDSDLCYPSARREHDGDVGPALDGPLMEDTKVFKGLQAHIAGTCKPCIFSMKNKCCFSEEDCSFCHLGGHVKSNKRSSMKKRKSRNGKGLQGPAGPLWADYESGSVSHPFGLVARRQHVRGVNFGPALDGSLAEDTQGFKDLLAHIAGTGKPCSLSMQKFYMGEVVLDEAEKEKAGGVVASRLQAAGGEEVGPREAQAKEEMGPQQVHGLFLPTRCKSSRGTDELRREKEASSKKDPPASTKGLDSHIAGTCKPCFSWLRGKCRLTEDECAYCHLDGYQWKKRPSRRQRQQERRHGQSLAQHLLLLQEGDLSA